MSYAVFAILIYTGDFGLNWIKNINVTHCTDILVVVVVVVG